jgi:hypothetical protein
MLDYATTMMVIDSSIEEQQGQAYYLYRNAKTLVEVYMTRKQ